MLFMKNDGGVTQDGFYWINSSGSSTLTYCFMTAPWGEPDYYIFTPWTGTWGSDQYTRDHGWYHVDNAGQGNMGSVQYAYGPGYDYLTFVVTIVQNVEELIAMMFLLGMLFTGMVLDLTVEEIEPSVTLV